MGGVTINPVAGLAKPPEPGPSPVEQYANLLKLKQMGQAGVLQQQQGQINQEQLKQQQIATQQSEQQQKDQEAFRTAMSDPSMKGKTIGDIADTLAQSGNISQTAWQAAKKADTEHRKDLAEADEKTLKNRKEAHDATQNLYNNAMQMPDDQLQANWPQIAQQYNSIPGNEKMPLDPNKPLPKQALAQFAPVIDMGNAYFDQELARREKVTELAGKQATTQKTQMEVAQGGGSTDLSRHTANYLKAHELADTPGNRLKAEDDWIQKNKIAPAQVRVDGIAKSRYYNVLDTKQGNSPVMVSADELGRAQAEEPGRYLSSGEGSKALGKTALIEDIRGNLQQVRQSLSNPKMPEFSADQRAQIAIALGKPEATGAISSVIRGGVLGSLGPEQQEYLINMAQLTENAMAMRSVLGAGQGSVDLRDAIKATLPGPRTPTKDYGLKQLDAFEKVLDRLEKGIPNVPLSNRNQNQGGTPQPSPTPGKGSTGNQKVDSLLGKYGFNN